MNILHIDCSPRSQSYSRRLSAAIVDRLRAIHPKATVIRRDLGSDQIPHAAPEYAIALASPAALSAASSRDAVRLSEELIVELEASNILVIGTPMNNFAVPSVLKAWIDQIVRVGRTFRVTPTGKIGVLQDRPVFVGIASGSIFSGDHASQPDFLTPYLSAVFRCIGLNSLHFLPFQGTAFLDEHMATIERDLLLSSFDTAIAATKQVEPSLRAKLGAERRSSDGPAISNGGGSGEGH
jgi:FMN-dependent NADH-azoreductase